MNSIWGAELNYAPDYWPLWLIYAGVVIVLMIAPGYTRAVTSDVVTQNSNWRRTSGLPLFAGSSPLALG